MIFSFQLRGNININTEIYGQPKFLLFVFVIQAMPEW